MRFKYETHKVVMKCDGTSDVMAHVGYNFLKRVLIMI